jgi:hypothetical protein
MKLDRLVWPTRDESELIATFGDACLVKYLDGKIKLVGGSPDDRIAARNWCSHFLPDGLIYPSPPPTARPTMAF